MTPPSSPSSVAYWGQLGAIAGSHWDRGVNLGCLGRAVHPHLHETPSPLSAFVSGQMCLRGSPRVFFPGSCAALPHVVVLRAVFVVELMVSVVLLVVPVALLLTTGGPVNWAVWCGLLCPRRSGASYRVPGSLVQGIVPNAVW